MEIQNTIDRFINYLPSLIPAVVVFIVVIIVIQVIKRVVNLRIRKFDEQELVDAVADQIDKINLPISIITGLHLGASFVDDANEQVIQLLYFLFIVIWSWQGIQLIMRVITYLTNRIIAKASDADVSMYRFLGTIAKVIVLIIVALLVLSNLGYDVSSLVAGLGISGIAVALAVQTILSDFISSVSIVADKPFRVGDFIIVNGFKGNVEKVGVRSTLVRSLDGEDLIIPNSELVKSTVQNFGTIQQRRSVHILGVTYETDKTLVKDIPVFIDEIIEANPRVSNETKRIHFIGFGDSALEFELSFDIISTQYKEYLDIQQEVLFEIMDKFTAEGIDFAYPTHTVYNAKT